MPSFAAREKKVEKEPAVRWLHGVVVEVFDGDTLVLNDGTRVRLLDINTPETSHEGRAAQAGSGAAAKRLGELVLGEVVAVSVRGKGFDRYGRTLGHVYLHVGAPHTPRRPLLGKETLPAQAERRPSPIWVNGVLVREGVAHVYTFADNVRFGRELMVLEDAARAEGRGLWADARWRVRDARVCCGDADMGRFALVEGTVRSVAAAGKAVYVNFGEDYRTDYTVWVKRKDLKEFKRVGWGELGCLQGAVVRVRGRLDPVDGVLVRVTHPEQLDVLRGGNCKTVKR